MRAPLAVLLLLIGAAPAAAQGVVVLQGRLIHIDGASTEGLRVGFGPFGSTVTSENGRFTTAVPADAAEVVVELLDHEWTVLFPREGRLAIPRARSVSADIVVGESVGAQAARLLAQRHERLAGELAQIGAAQASIQGFLELFREEMMASMNVQAADLEREIERERQRVEHFPALSASIEDYVLEAKDLNDAFRLYGRAAFTDRAARDFLVASIREYNDAFEQLSNRRMAFEHQVATFWKSEELRSDLRALYDYALGEIHDVRVLQLNASLVAMSEAPDGRARDRREIEEAQARIARITEDLAPRLVELERRSDRVLQYLSRD